MIEKIKKYVKEIAHILSAGKYNEKIVNYDNRINRIKELYRERLKKIEKEIPGLEKNYKEALFERACSGTGYRGEKPRDIKERIKNYQEEISPDCARVFYSVIEGTKEFMKYEYSLEENVNFDFTLLQDRPSINTEWGQAHCTEETCLKRVKLILRDFVKPGTKVLFIGDDDLNSLILKSLSNFEVYVLDIDERLLEFIERKEMGIHTLRVDLTKDVPQELIGNFDAVAINPYWNIDGINMFLKAGQTCIKKNKESRIYMTIWPVTLSLKDYVSLQKDILDMELIFREILPFFDWYDLSKNKCNFSNILSRINRDIKDPLLEKITEIPATTAYMFVLGHI